MPESQESSSVAARRGPFLALLFGAIAAVLGAILHDRLEAPASGALGFSMVAVGFLIALGIRTGSGGVAHVSYRWLGLVLCYASVSATFVPEVLASSRVAVPGVLLWLVAWASAFPEPLLLPFDGPLIATGILGTSLYAAWRFAAPRPFTWEPPSRREPRPPEVDLALDLAAHALIAARTQKPSSPPVDDAGGSTTLETQSPPEAQLADSPAARPDGSTSGERPSPARRGPTTLPPRRAN